MSEPPAIQPATTVPEITRLAPSPTGALHLGNARTFLVNWALARRAGWRIVLRIEDLDGPRVKPEAIDGVRRTLEWLGMDWDIGPLIQSADPAPYVNAMRSLAERGMAYPCELTRAEIEAAASAPQAIDSPALATGSASLASSPATGESVFPSSLRPSIAGAPTAFTEAATNWRFLTPASRVVHFVDDFAGPQSRCPAETIGDFVLWTKRAQASYQLAVVVDDARQGVTRVVRGDDLLDSAARQMLLYEALGLGTPPRYLHLPLVVGPDGRRLAKRHGDTRVDTYRQRFVPPERLIGLIAHWCGRDTLEPMSAQDFAYSLDMAAFAKHRHGPIQFTPEDDAWLLRGN
ncbi:MAG: hypothetical protein K2X32_13945 [Phycisphaerales bacterium]|nr:hypothetical protein [Phycisphaerales bacterium]